MSVATTAIQVTEDGGKNWRKLESFRHCWARLRKPDHGLESRCEHRLCGF